MVVMGRQEWCVGGDDVVVVVVRQEWCVGGYRRERCVGVVE